MTSQTKIKYALLAEWLRSLEAEGYAFGVDKRLQFQELLDKLPEKTTLHELKLLLTPLIAQNEQEQNLVYSIFERARKRVEAIHKIEQKIEPTAPPAKMGWLKPLIALLTFLTALLALLLLIPDVVENEEPHVTKFFSSTPSTSDTICLDSSDLAIYEKLSLPIQEVALCQSQNQIDSSLYGSYQIGDDLCLIYTAKDSLGQDSICLQLIDSERDTFFAYFKPTIEQKNIIDTTVTGTPLATSVSFQAENYPVETDIHSLQIEPLTSFEQFYLNNEWWLRLLFYILSAVITLLILLVRERNRRQLVAEVQSNDQAPNIWNVETGETPNIQLEQEYDLLLNNLRQRTTADQRVFDVPRTIQATIDKAGMTNFQYRFRTRPPEYLLLINQRSRDNHRARWYDHLYHYFLENEVLVDRFFYDEDPRLCWNETYVDGLKLKDLQQLHPEARLMLVGTGYSLLNPLTGKSAKWTKVFDLWKERAIFSPTPTADWGRKERLLEQSFVMLPASMQALQFYVSQLELGSEAEFGNWKNQVEDAQEYGINIKPEIGDIPMQLSIHYDENVVKWIAACAVYPSLHWDLTMRLGDLLSEDEQSLLTSENISDLNRLSWFTEGEIPPEIRANLIEWLEAEHSETLEKVRFELHDLLQQNPPPKDSIAWEEHHLNTSFNEWLITADTKRKKQLEQEIAANLAKGTEPDFTVIKYLDRPKSPLDFVVPDAWKKHVYQGGFSGLGFKGLGTDIFWAIPIWLLACFLVWFVEPNISEQCEGDLANNLLLEVDGRQFTFPYNPDGTGIEPYEILPSKARDSITIVSNRPSNAVIVAKNLSTISENNLLGTIFCIDQPSDRILLGEYIARFGIVANDDAIVDSITIEVQEVYETINGSYYPEEKQLADSLWNAYQKNLSVDYWNYAIPLFEEWKDWEQKSDSIYRLFRVSNDEKLYASLNEMDSIAQATKRSACSFFERAWQLDSLNEDRIDARLWCEERTYNIRLEIASSLQAGIANEIQKAIEENNYQVQEIKPNTSIRTSEIVYFYEEDRLLAYRLLKRAREILVDIDLEIKQETPPLGPGDPRKGEIVIRLAQQDVSRPPTTVTQEEPITLLFYAARYNPQQIQAINKYLGSEGYILDQSQPFSWIVERSTIFYYNSNRNGQREANRLADNLEKRFGYEIQVRASEGQLNTSFDSNKTLGVYFIGNETQQDSRFPILSGIRLNRITRNPNIRIQWLNPTDQRVESGESKYRIELGVTSNQSLAVGNMWIEHNGRILENKKENLNDKNASQALRYTYDYARTIDLLEGNNVLKFLVINENQEVVKESSTIIINKVAQKEDLPNNILPVPSIDLYFENEQPEEKSTATYDELFNNYYRRRDIYKISMTENNKKADRQELAAEVDDFFNTELRNNYQYFGQMMEQIRTYLEQGYELQICLQATVTAGGISSYNNQLIDRRIRSIERSLAQYEEGTLAPYLRNGALVIQQLPAIGNSDKLATQDKEQKQELEEERNYTGRSGYQLFLAQERKISIVSVGRKRANCTD